jgi:hypothetical protein
MPKANKENDPLPTFCERQQFFNQQRNASRYAFNAHNHNRPHNCKSTEELMTFLKNTNHGIVIGDSDYVNKYPPKFSNPKKVKLEPNYRKTDVDECHKKCKRDKSK